MSAHDKPLWAGEFGPAPQQAARTATLAPEDGAWLAWAIVRIADHALAPGPCSPLDIGTHRAVAVRDLNAIRSLAITCAVLARPPGENS